MSSSSHKTNRNRKPHITASSKQFLKEKEKTSIPKKRKRDLKVKRKRK
jgi:hypothetical protein